MGCMTLIAILLLFISRMLPLLKPEECVIRVLPLKDGFKSAQCLLKHNLKIRVLEERLRLRTLNKLIIPNSSFPIPDTPLLILIKLCAKK